MILLASISRKAPSVVVFLNFKPCVKEFKCANSATEAAEKLKGMTIKVGAKVGEAGKIFGSVNNIQLAEAMTKAGHPVDRKNIDLGSEVIRDLGTYTAKVKLHKEVIVDISFEVVAE